MKGGVGGVVATVACGGALGAFVLLGGWWTLDRTRRWETPKLDPVPFSAVRDVARQRVGAAGFALIPVNLRCPHCLEALRRFQAARLESGDPQLVVLIVDTDREPSEGAIASLRADRVWWDRRGIWRHRWGHRIYGEVVRFDASGRYRGTSPPPAGWGARAFASDRPR